MNTAHNPFAPGAGTQPPELTGREKNLGRAQDILSRIRNRKYERGLVLTGLRGVGKTVLLNRILKLSEAEGYQSFFIEAPEGSNLASMLVPNLRKVLLRIDRGEKAKETVRAAASALRAFATTFKVQVGEIKIGVEPSRGLADSGILDQDVTDLLEIVARAAAEAEVCVAFFIDEMQYLEEKELAALLAGLHRVNQLNLPLVVFGAGLPQLAGLTGKAKSYAERLLEYHSIGKLNDEDARKAIQDPLQEAGVKITEGALDEIVHQTEGYPYFLQEWGFHSWNEAKTSPITVDDVQKATLSATGALDQGFFRVRFDRLSKGEKEYLRAMAELGSGPHRSGDVAGQMLRQVRSVAPIRSQILEKGMIYSPSYGDTAFTVPKFDEYLKRVIPSFVPKIIKR